MTEKQKPDISIEELRDYMGDKDLDFIGIDDTFDFECQQCGRCCINREDIILNPFDVYKGARSLGITCLEFVENYTTLQYGSNSGLPILLLTSDEETGFCKLLNFDIKDGGKFKCAIHHDKPGACWNHPIGLLSYTPIELRYDENKKEEVAFVKTSQCENSKGHNSPKLVRDWVKPSIEHAEELKYAHMLQSYVERYFPMKLFFYITGSWLALASLFGEQNPEAETTCSLIKEIKTTFTAEYCTLLYTQFDINKPFIPQVKANMAQLDTMLKGTAVMLKDLWAELPDFAKKEGREKILNNNNQRYIDWLEGGKDNA